MADINLLHPDLKPLCISLIDQLTTAIAPSTVKVNFTYRPPAAQDALYAQGRTTPGKIVTDLTSSKSKHCFTLDGLPAAKAFDIAIFNLDGSYVGYGDDLRYQHAGALWKILATVNPTLGMVWGGDWHHPHDPDHFQIA